MTITLIPVTILFSSLLITGVIGNILVLYGNSFRIKKNTSRVYILSLAAFDLTTCVLGLPFNILTLVYPLNFVWDHACKALIFSMTFTIMGSIFFLLLLAVERYRKICKPLEKQFSFTKIKITCWTTVIVSTVVAIPMIFIYGSVDVDTKILNVTGKDCYISNDYVGFIYHGFILLIIILSFFILTGLYIKIGIVLWKRRKIHGTQQNLVKFSASGKSTAETTISQINITNDECTVSTLDPVHLNKSNQEHIADQLCNFTSITRESEFKRYRKNKNQRSATTLKKAVELHRKRSKRPLIGSASIACDESASVVSFGKFKCTCKKQMKSKEITVMLFIVTLIFIISFLPYLIISIMNGIEEKFWSNKSNWEVIFYNLSLRSYFINSMINPIVYWFLDTSFKQEVQRFYKNIRQCDWTKYFKQKYTY